MNLRTLILCASATLLVNSADADTFTVTNTADTGGGSLRQAIMDANTHMGADTISFNIPGSDPNCNATTHVCTITPASALPAITDPVLIDGYTQPGASANTLAVGDNAVLLIEIAGTNTNAVLNLQGSSGSTIRGLVLDHLTNGPGINIDTSPNNTITGNFIGVDPTGTTASAGGTTGVSCSSTSGTVIGGTTPAARNVISSGGGVVSLQSSTGNTVQGNYIGINAAGTGALPAFDGIFLNVNCTGNTIGGTVSGAGNVFGNFSDLGVRLEFGSGSNTIQGNLIGTNATGTASLTGSGRGGIEVAANFGAQAADNEIGGTAAGAGNLISGVGGDGIITVGGTGTVIQGNRIGTDITGTTAIPNAGCGVNVSNSASGTGTIGGTAARAGNIIAFNGTSGVCIASNNTGWAIEGNSIFSNGGLGIDLGADGVTLNDAGDVDTGANNLQNFPVLTSVTSSGGNISIAGMLNSAANTTYRIEFFANDSVDPSGYGEGKVFAGFANVPTDANGNASFNVSVPQTAGNLHITATATDPNGNTSEFSAAIGQLLNISTRLRVLTGDNALIGGFILTGTEAKKVIVRGIGPSLTSQGVPGALQDPTLELHDGSGATIASNDNWKDTQQTEIQATGIPPSNDLESAIVRTLPANNSGYTAILRGKNDTTGVGLVEVYDLDQAANSKLANISTRGFVDTGDNAMIGGFIAGNGLTKVIVRAIGPSLTSQGVPGALQDPTLELHDGTGATIASNDNWKDTQQSDIEATTIPPTDERESAIVTTLSPGPYTAIVRGKNNTTGVALVEVYNLQ